MGTFLLKMIDLGFQYDFMIKCYLLDVFSHVVIMTIHDVLRLSLETMTHHIQTT